MPDISLFRPTLNSFVAPADLNLINSQYNKLEQGHQQAVAQASDYELALAQLDLNPDEDAWRQQQVANIRSALNDNMQFGNAYSSLDDIMRSYADIRSNPGMIGRLRAQQDYKTYITNLENNKTLSQDTKDYYKWLNTYHYEDKYDANGNVIGGTEWTPIEHETDTVDMAAVIDNAISKLKPEGSQGDAFYYKTADGRFTTNRSEAANGLPYFKTTSGYTQLSSDRIREAILAEIDNTPGARASLEQDLKVGKWKHNRDGLEVSEVTDDLGNFLNYNQYLEKRINGVYHSVAYTNRSSSMSTSVGFDFDLAERKAELEVAKKKAINSGLGGDGINYTDFASAIMDGPQYKAKTSGAENIAAMQDQAQTIIKKYADSLHIPYDKFEVNTVYGEIKKAAADGQPIPKYVQDAYRSYNQQMDKLRQIIPADKWDEYYGKLAIKSAIDSGSDMSNLGDYAKDYMKIARETLATLGVTDNSSGKLRINNVDIARGQIKNPSSLDISLEQDEQGYYYKVDNSNVGNIGYIAQLLGDNANVPAFNMDLTPPENESFIERISRYLGSGKRIAGTKAGWDTTVFTNPLLNLQRYYNSITSDISPLVSDGATIISGHIYSQSNAAELNALASNEKWADRNNALKQANATFISAFKTAIGADHDIAYGESGDVLEYVDDPVSRNNLLIAARAVYDRKPDYVSFNFYETSPQDEYIRFRIPDTTENGGNEIKAILDKAGIKLTSGKEYVLKVDNLNQDMATKLMQVSPSIRAKRNLQADINAGVREFRNDDGGIVTYLGNDAFAFVPDASNPTSSIYNISSNDVTSRMIADDALYDLKYNVSELIADHRNSGTEITDAEVKAINSQIANLVVQYGYPYNPNGEQTSDFIRVYSKLKNDVWNQNY